MIHSRRNGSSWSFLATTPTWECGAYVDMWRMLLPKSSGMIDILTFICRTMHGVNYDIMLDYIDSHYSRIGIGR